MSEERPCGKEGCEGLVTFDTGFRGGTAGSEATHATCPSCGTFQALNPSGIQRIYEDDED